MAFKMKGSSYKMGGHKTKATMAYMKSPMRQAESTDMSAGNIRDAEIAGAMADDDALIERLKTEKPDVYEKIMKHYQSETEGGSKDLGTGKQGAHTYRTRPFDHFLGIEETGIDMFDQYLRKGRQRLRQEKADKVRGKMVDFIKKGGETLWRH